MNESLPPKPDQNRQLVYESEDNPVVRARTLERENNKTRLGLLVIFLILFVPPDDRTKVIRQLPQAALDVAPVFGRVLRFLFLQ